MSKRLCFYTINWNDLTEEEIRMFSRLESRDAVHRMGNILSPRPHEVVEDIKLLINVALTYGGDINGTITFQNTQGVGLTFHSWVPG